MQEVTLSTADGGLIDFLLFGPHYSVLPATCSSYLSIRVVAGSHRQEGAEGEGYLSVAVWPDGGDEAAVPLDPLHQAVMAGGAVGLQSGREGALRRKTQDKQQAERQRAGGKQETAAQRCSWLQNLRLPDQGQARVGGGTSPGSPEGCGRSG